MVVLSDYSTTSSQRKLGSPSIWQTSRGAHHQEIPAFAGMTYGGWMAQGGYVYIMSNRKRGLPYIGVTAHLAHRVHQHRCGEGSAYCKRYNLTKLVYIEPHETIEAAIAREKAMKAWKRPWKIELIEKANPNWDDL